MGQEKKFLLWIFNRKCITCVTIRKIIFCLSKCNIYCIKLNINSKYKLHFVQLSLAGIACILFSLVNYVDYYNTLFYLVLGRLWKILSSKKKDNISWMNHNCLKHSKQMQFAVKISIKMSPHFKTSISYFVPQNDPRSLYKLGRHL